jgi:hypothetical protein
MPAYELFSKRQKRLRGETLDVFTYAEIPLGLRNQVVHLWMETIGGDYWSAGDSPPAYEEIHDTFCREHGMLSLVDKRYFPNYVKELAQFFTDRADTDQALDLIELTFRYLERAKREGFDYAFYSGRRTEPDEAIAELNQRFLEHGVGYQFESGELIRVDSMYLHAEAVRPSLALLSPRKGTRVRTRSS